MQLGKSSPTSLKGLNYIKLQRKILNDEICRYITFK